MGGIPCLGADAEEKECENIPLCAIDGDWSDWSEWKSCSKSCGIGITSRSRTCTNPYPRNGGKFCDGMSLDIKYCNINPCPINGEWSNWSFWSRCSKTCGKGHQIRKRFCNNPEPKNGGNDCFGENIEYQECLAPSCIRNSWKKTLDSEYSEEDLEKYGAHAEIEINQDFKSREKTENESKRFPNYEYLSQNNMGHFSKNDNQGKVKPGIPKVTVSVDSYRPISEETYNSYINGNLKDSKIDKFLEFENDDSHSDDDYKDESDAEYFSQELDDTPQYKQKNCQQGFFYDEFNDQCDDINECTLPKTKCPKHSKCVNLPGSFRCDCNKGFRLVNNRCLDMNECSIGHDCSHFCENTMGSYKCKCPEGMNLNRNGKTCETAAFKRRVREGNSNRTMFCGNGFVWNDGKCVGEFNLN